MLEQVPAGTLGLVSSPTLLAELALISGRARFDGIVTRSNTSPENALAEVRYLAEIIEPPSLTVPACREPDDDAVLTLALAAQDDLIVSGDDDLLSLRHYQDISILNPIQAIAQIDR